MVSLKENHGERKEIPKTIPTTSLKRNLLKTPKKRILPIKSVKRCLRNFHPKKSCPARLSKCKKCSKIGHWAQACKSSKPGKLFEVAEEGESFFLGEMVNLGEVQSNPIKSPWMATVPVDKNPVDFKFDIGAAVTIVPYNTFLNLDLQTQLQPTDKVLLGPCNYKMNCKGRFTVTLTYNLNSVKVTLWKA